MKKLVLSIAAGLLLAPGFVTAKETTFSGEIMDSQCAKGGGTSDVQERGDQRS